MATEKQYDEIIAPMLIEVAKKCEELGMALVARVEWKPTHCGITQIGDNEWSFSQLMTQYAAHCHGNIDKLCLSLIKKFPESIDQSLFLRRFKEQ